MAAAHVTGTPRPRLHEVERFWSTAVTRGVERLRCSRPGAALDSLALVAAALLDAPVAVSLLEDGHLRRRASVSGAADGASLEAPPVPALCCAAVAGVRTVRWDDVLTAVDAEPPASEPGPDATRVRAVLAVPLVTQGTVLGVVWVVAHRPGWFGYADEQALLALAGVAADRVVAERIAEPADRTVTEVKVDHVAAERAGSPERIAEGPPTGRVPVQPGPERSIPPLPSRRSLRGQEPGDGPADALCEEPREGRYEALREDLAGGADEGLAEAAGEPGLRAVGLWQWDAGTGRLSCSPQVAATLGLAPGARVRLDVVRDLVHPEDLPRFDESLLHQVGRRLPVEGEFRVVTPGGQLRHVHAWSDVRVERDRIVGAFGGVADVTARRTAEAVMRRQGTALRGAGELVGMGFWQWAPATGELTWSPEMFRMAGLAPGEIEPTLAHWHRLVHPDDLRAARRLDVDSLDRVHGHAEVVRVLGADGVQRHLRIWAVPVPAEAGGRVVQGAAVDVTGQVQDGQAFERLSATDAVTGLGNRLAFERRIADLLADPSRDVSLLLLDLDRFKLVNDSLGHQVGDRLLAEVARRLTRVVPAGSLIARMGGDEFVVVPRPGVGWLQVRRLAKTVVETLRRPYVLPESGEMLVCPVSVGVTGTSGRAVGPQDLLSEADLALYQAKDLGRDRYVVFDDELRSRARGRHFAEQRLRSALERGWLTLRYQPIADLRSGRVVGAEALVRIQEPTGALVLPDSFIEVAEDTGLVVELDCWVIDNALRQLQSWAGVRGRRNLPWLAVNVSARSMEHPRVVERLLEGVRRFGLPPRSVKVELTERSFLGTLPGGENALRALLDSGIPVGIDDFGTGYSALAYLQRFDLDFMKIDRSFVASVGQAERADAVATAIVGLAHAHGMQVTAEGIEQPVQARRLCEIGCDFAQGFHVGRPVEAALLLD